ncbi:MAG: BrnA antitoxin family protein [Parvibaculum sp.]
MNDLPRGKTDWERLRNLSDEDIAKSIANDPDTVPLDLDWSDAELVLPSRKKAVSIRLDEDVLNFFKETGSRYQTRINEVLRSYMKAQRRKSEKV